jgi:hypothetical protein
VDAGQVDYLYGRLLEGEAEEVTVIRGALLPHEAEVSERLWSILIDRQADMSRRFRAACALASYTPKDPRWEKVSSDVAAWLVIQNAVVLGKWADALQPVGNFLLPALACLLEDEQRTGAERSVIANVYKTYAEGQPNAFVHLERVVEQPKGNVDLAKRQANVSVALMLLGRSEKVWPLLKHSPDPTVRSFVIDRLAPGGVDPKLLMTRLDREDDTSIKRAILLALGEFGLDRLLQVERQRLIPKLLQLYRDDFDPGIHSAAEWLLRKWQAGRRVVEVDKELATGRVEGKRLWYINRQGQTMIVVPKPGVFRLGQAHQGRNFEVSRNYVIGAKEVTLEQLLRFRKDHIPIKGRLFDGPVENVPWVVAAAYCNWLSEQDGIPKDQWCYEPNEKGEYASGMKMATNYLQRTGYRLPTKAEWEYACAAGADTLFSFGQGEELLGKYAWFVLNSQAHVHPVGMLRPNDLGLFDMYGNVAEWLQDSWTGKGEMLSITHEDSRAFAATTIESNLEYDFRQRTWGGPGAPPLNRCPGIGFRPVRTIR